MLREEGYDEPIYIHGALKRLCEFYQDEGIDLGELRPATIARGKDAEGAAKAEFAGAIIVGPPSALPTSGRGAFPIRSRASPPAGCACGAGRASAASSCR